MLGKVWSLGNVYGRDVKEGVRVRGKIWRCEEGRRGVRKDMGERGKVWEVLTKM